MVTVVILGRELAVTLLGGLRDQQGRDRGKQGLQLKTAAQILAIVLYLMPLTGAAETFAHVVMGLAVILTVVTGVD